MKAKLMISSDAIEALDSATSELRRMLILRCREVAKSKQLVDKPVVALAYKSVVNEIFWKLKDDVDRSAA